MASFNQLVKDKIDRIDNIPDKFANGVTKFQRAAYERITELLKQLELTPTGTIALTDANFAIVNQIGNAIPDTIYQTGYLEDVRAFMSEFDQQAVINTDLYKSIGEVNIESANQALYNQSKQIAAEQLTTGLSTQIQSEVKALLNQAVSTSSNYTDLLTNLRNYFEGSQGLEGSMQRYVKQQAFDLFTITDRQYSNSLADQFEIEFYKYQGGTKDTSREFCVERAGKVYHKKEIEGWGEGQKCCGLSYPQSGSWPGMAKGTNASTIFALAGGYNCSHVFIPVGRKFVPPDVLERAIESGYTT